MNLTVFHSMNGFINGEINTVLSHLTPSEANVYFLSRDCQTYKPHVKHLDLFIKILLRTFSSSKEFSFTILYIFTVYTDGRNSWYCAALLACSACCLARLTHQIKVMALAIKNNLNFLTVLPFLIGCTSGSCQFFLVVKTWHIESANSAVAFGDFTPMQIFFNNFKHLSTGEFGVLTEFSC